MHLEAPRSISGPSSCKLTPRRPGREFAACSLYRCIAVLRRPLLFDEFHLCGSCGSLPPFAFLVFPSCADPPRHHSGRRAEYHKRPPTIVIRRLLDIFRVQYRQNAPSCAPNCLFASSAAPSDSFSVVYGSTSGAPDTKSTSLDQWNAERTCSCYQL